jgi:hypothetical protein
MLTLISISVILTLSLILNIFLYKALKAQLKKLSIYESHIIEYNNWVDNVRNDVRSTYLKMKDMDDKNIFYKDDEVGVVFQELLTLLTKLNDRIQR